MELKILNLKFSVIKYKANHSIPKELEKKEMVSITRTDEELSIVCPAQYLMTDEEIIGREDGWKCIKIEGLLDFALVGILSSIANPLAENGISIFALSTFNTDYILLKEKFLKKAIHVLKEEGHNIYFERQKNTI